MLKVWEKSVDQDQLASVKPADQDLHFFPLKYMQITGILKVDWIGEECSTLI